MTAALLAGAPSRALALGAWEWPPPGRRCGRLRARQTAAPAGAPGQTGRQLTHAL